MRDRWYFVWSRKIAAEEDMWHGACLECAKSQGYTEEQADKCENGDLNCVCCPFKKEKK